MSKAPRGIRGALGIGLTWGLLWILVGALLGLWVWIVDPTDIGPGEGPGRALPILGLVGLLSGFGFALILSTTERRRSLQRLSLWRVALWGCLGSAAIPLLMGADGSMGWLTGALGAVFATTSVTIARRGSRMNDAQSPAVQRGVEADGGLTPAR
jgi:membrane associated rhomboid family serine protease